MPNTYAKPNQREVPENFYRPTHGRTLSWYVRLVPPTALRGVPGVREFRKSTGTADLRKAKAIGAQMIAEKRAEWDQLLSEGKQSGAVALVLTADHIEHICARRLYHWMRIDDMGRFEGLGHDDESHAALTQICQLTDKSMRSVLARGRSAPEWATALEVLDFWCEQMGASVSRTDPLYPTLVRQFAEVELEASSRVLRRNQGEAAATPPEPNPIAACLSAMTELYRDYKKQRSGGKHTGTSVHVWTRLIEHLGDVSLNTVKAADLYDFLQARMRAPEKPWSMKHAHGFVKRTLREVFALARTHRYGVKWCSEVLERPTMATKKKAAAGKQAPRLSVSFPADLKKTLEQIAKEQKVSLSWVVRDAAEKYVSDRWPLLARR